MNFIRQVVYYKNRNENYMHPEVKKLIDYFQFERIPLEGTLYKSTYRSAASFTDHVPAGTAIIALYCREPFSESAFHRLSRDETWHFYKGDPFKLFLLYEDGSSAEVIMGADILAGHHVQFTVPAGVWQAGSLLPDSDYALFGCTMTPGFTVDCFESGIASELVVKYPHQKDIILKFAPNSTETRLPDGYEG
ncbi:MAG TPA: cupin domain-containing protein [Chitinophagaceae bacterium]|nr:cupin domain-containing protein [Chitinophagaceae bacterium]